MRPTTLPARTHTTLATWLGLLGTHGVLPAGEASALVKALLDARAPAAAQAAAEALEQHVRGLLHGEDEQAVRALATSWFGDRAQLGAGVVDRAARLVEARRWTFRERTPWLARVWQRDRTGGVGPHWVIVQRVVDLVELVDPDPWDEVDEERALDPVEFQALWELSGCAAVRVS